MKKRDLLIIPTLLGLFLTACGSSGSGNSTPTGDSSGAQKYTVTYNGTNMSNTQVQEGGQLSKPTDPSKDGYIFVGWYTDANYSQEVSFPLTINGNTTIYAQFYSYKDAFARARNNTIGDSVTGYEYDYTLSMSAGYMGLALNGNTTGNSKYNKNSNDVKLYDVHTNSGALFYDGSKYEILKGNSLHSISVDENGSIKKYVIKDVGADYKYDSSSFAKAVFEYEDSKLKSITKTSTPNEYKLSTSFNASAGIALVGNYVNHPMVEKLIGALPETSVTTGMYVTFSGNKLNSYRYEMNIDVSGVSLTLNYGLTFKNSQSAPTITPAVFNDTAVSNSDVASVKNELNSIINYYKTQEHSSYEFEAKTAVDYAKKNAINATIDGFTKRKVSNGVSYYLNDYEVDTDHKNADLYKAKGLGDCHGARVKLSNGEVHDLKKKLLGGYSDVATVSHNSVDDFYLLDVLANLNTITFIQKKTNSKSEVVYYIGGDDASAVEVLNYFNNNLRLNPLGECSVDVKAFGSFQSSSVKVKDFKFSITVFNALITEINLTMNGALVASFPESRDFTNPDDAGFKLTYNLKVNNDGASYEPAAEVSKVK